MQTQAPSDEIESEARLLRRTRLILAANGLDDLPKLESAIFDYLVTLLILRHGYDGITDIMLEHASEDMLDIARNCSGQPPHAIHPDSHPSHAGGESGSLSA